MRLQEPKLRTLDEEITRCLETMAEYVSKQNILDYLNGYLHSLGYDNTDLHVNGQRGALINAIHDISAVKAEDVQPVKHGQWIEHNDWIECNVCGFEVNDIYCEKRDMTCTETSYDYCPKCGARMIKDGEKE